RAQTPFEQRRAAAFGLRGLGRWLKRNRFPEIGIERVWLGRRRRAFRHRLRPGLHLRLRLRRAGLRRSLRLALRLSLRLGLALRLRILPRGLRRWLAAGPRLRLVLRLVR